MGGGNRQLVLLPLCTPPNPPPPLRRRLQRGGAYGKGGVGGEGGNALFFPVCAQRMFFRSTVVLLGLSTLLSRTLWGSWGEARAFRRGRLFVFMSAAREGGAMGELKSASWLRPARLVISCSV